MQGADKGGNALAQGPRILTSERLKPYVARGQPHACELCRQRINDKLGFEPGSVVHADLIPSLVGLRIFQAMPAGVRAKAVLAALTGKGACAWLLGSADSCGLRISHGEGNICTPGSMQTAALQRAS